MVRTWARKCEDYKILIWNVNGMLKIITLFVGSLGATPKQFGNRLKKIGITVGTTQVQKTVVLGTA